jgi:hypothetical protein
MSARRRGVRLARCRLQVGRAAIDDHAAGPTDSLGGHEVGAEAEVTTTTGSDRSDSSG